MRVRLALAAIAAVAAGVALSAGAEETVPQIPEEYMVGRGPAGLPPPPQAAPKVAAAKAAGAEAPQAINGSGYAVIAPTYNGGGGTLSYIRLFNGGSFVATVSVTVVGSPSGNTYGSANILVPVRASLQIPLVPDGGNTLSITQRANAAALSGGDTSYALYLQSAEVTAGYQHVTYNGINQFFENNSICSNLLSQAVSAVVQSAVVTNVHTTRLAAYPSTVDIHNFFNVGVNYRFTIIDAATGVVINNTVLGTAANASYSLPMSFLQQQINWTPTADQVHANIVVTEANSGAIYLMLGQSIFNQSLNANVNMSTACAINAAQTGSGGGGGGGFGGGGISY